MNRCGSSCSKEAVNRSLNRNIDCWLVVGTETNRRFSLHRRAGGGWDRLTVDSRFTEEQVVVGTETNRRFSLHRRVGGGRGADFDRTLSYEV